MLKTPQNSSHKGSYRFFLYTHICENELCIKICSLFVYIHKLVPIFNKYLIFTFRCLKHLKLPLIKGVTFFLYTHIWENKLCIKICFLFVYIHKPVPIFNKYLIFTKQKKTKEKKCLYREMYLKF